MFRNFRGKQNIYGYYPPGVAIGDNFVFLNSLLSEESPKGRQLGQDAQSKLMAGFAEGDLFESHYYLQGLEILQKAIQNERNSELSALRAIQKQLEPEVKLVIPDLESSNGISEFYDKLQVVLDTIWDKEQKISSLLARFPGSEYGEAERVTQRFQLLLRAELFRTFNKGIHVAMGQDEVMESITNSLTGKGYSKVESAIIRAVTRMLYDATKLNDIQDQFLKKIYSEEEQDKRLIDNILATIKEPAGLQNTDKLLSIEGEQKIRQELAAKKKKRGPKAQKTKTILPVSKYYGNIEVKGLGLEAIDLITTALSGILGSVLSTGSALRKSDTIITIGEIAVDIDGLVNATYRDNPVYDRREEKGKSAYDFALLMQEAYRNAQSKIQNGLDSFIIHNSDKDYLAKTLVKQQGFSAGNGMNLKTLTGFLNNIGFVDTSFLIFALNNLSAEALGNTNKDTLSNFLAQFIGMFAFDDGLTIYSKEVQNLTPNVKAVHLFMLNGRRIPLSFLLQGVYDNISSTFQQVMTPNSQLQNFVKVTITSPTNFQGKLDALSSAKIFNRPRWEAVSRWSMEKTRIKMNFLKNFNDIINNIQASKI